MMDMHGKFVVSGSVTGEKSCNTSCHIKRTAIRMLVMQASESVSDAPLILPLKDGANASGQPAANGTQLAQFISPKRPFIHPTLFTI